MWSINERLGGGAGVSVPMLADDWLEDLCQLAEEEAENADGGGCGLDEDDLE